jgi:hypothetical protein
VIRLRPGHARPTAASHLHAGGDPTGAPPAFRV